MKSLGYVVMCYGYITDTSGSFQILVQSEKYNPNFVLDSIHEFFKGYFKNIKGQIDINKFQSVVEAERKSLQLSRETAQDTSNRVWSDLKTEKNQLLYNQRKKAVLSNLTTDTFLDFYYQNILNNTSRKMLTIVLYGHNKEIKLNVDCNIIYNKIDQTVNDLSSSCS